MIKLTEREAKVVEWFDHFGYNFTETHDSGIGERWLIFTRKKPLSFEAWIRTYDAFVGNEKVKHLLNKFVGFKTFVSYMITKENTIWASPLFAEKFDR